MKVKLILVLREQDNNNYTTELAKYFKDVELLIEPQWRMSIKIGNILFFIDHIIQDLDLKTITLFEYKDLHYRYVDEEFPKEREILSNDGWKLI